MSQTPSFPRDAEAPHSSAMTEQFLSIVGVDAAAQRAARIQDVQRPIVAMAADFPSQCAGVEHMHRRAQFLHSCSGVMTVTTASGNWIVPPQYALWIPAHTVHRTSYCGSVKLETLYLDPAAISDMPEACRLIEVRPFLSALVREALAFPAEYRLDGRERLIMDLLLLEIARMPQVQLHAPLPQDRRLLRVCQEYLRNPGEDHDLDHWTRVGNLSRRTLARLFLRETGMTFTDWRQRVKLLEAVVRMTSGQSVTTVALDLGYQSASAFTAMFRRKFGIPPTEYLRRTAVSD